MTSIFEIVIAVKICIIIHYNAYDAKEIPLQADMQYALVVALMFCSVCTCSTGHQGVPHIGIPRITAHVCISNYPSTLTNPAVSTHILSHYLGHFALSLATCSPGR